MLYERLRVAGEELQRPVDLGQARIVRKGLAEEEVEQDAERCVEAGEVRARVPVGNALLHDPGDGRHTRGPQRMEGTLKVGLDKPVLQEDQILVQNLHQLRRVLVMLAAGGRKTLNQVLADRVGHLGAQFFQDLQGK